MDTKKWHKLQQFLVLRAFNKRKAHQQTIYQQFYQLKQSRQVFVSGSGSGFNFAPRSASPDLNENQNQSQYRYQSPSPGAASADSPLVHQQKQEFLVLDDLCKYLQIPVAQRQLLVQKFHVQGDGRIPFQEFLLFLQTPIQEALQQQEKQQDKLPLPPPPSVPASPSTFTKAHDAAPRGATSSMSAALPADNQQQQDSSDSDPNQALVKYTPSAMTQRLRDLALKPPPVPGMWKKREISIHEKIIEYTKIDDQGKAQQLVEKEKTQTEVIHMETLNGEFAHREISHFEQLEQLNDEIVHQEDGREEFFHLKSKFDEISRFDTSYPNNQPRNRPPEDTVEQPPPSPSIKKDPSQSFADVFGSSSASRPSPFPQSEDQEEARYYRTQQQRDQQQQEQEQAQEREHDPIREAGEDEAEDEDDEGICYAIPGYPSTQHHPSQRQHLQHHDPDQEFTKDAMSEPQMKTVNHNIEPAFCG